MDRNLTVFVPSKSIKKDESRAFAYGQCLIANKSPDAGNPDTAYRQFLRDAQGAPFCTLDASQTKEKDLNGPFRPTADSVIKDVIPRNLAGLNRTVIAHLMPSGPKACGQRSLPSSQQPKEPTKEQRSSDPKRKKKQDNQHGSDPKQKMQDRRVHLQQPKRGKPAEDEHMDGFGPLMPTPVQDDGDPQQQKHVEDETSMHIDREPQNRPMPFTITQDPQGSPPLDPAEDSEFNKLFRVTKLNEAGDHTIIETFILFTPSWDQPTFEAYYIKVESRKAPSGMLGGWPQDEDTYKISAKCHYSRFTVNTSMLVPFMKQKEDAETKIVTYLSTAIENSGSAITSPRHPHITQK
jgi:hypothetical protein